jgi:hypothetical protein
VPSSIELSSTRSDIRLLSIITGPKRERERRRKRNETRGEGRKSLTTVNDESLGDVARIDPGIGSIRRLLKECLRVGGREPRPP